MILLDMIKKYIDQLLTQVIYYPDENGVIIAKIPNKVGYCTQGDTVEEARENMIDLIETLLIDQIRSWTSDFVENFYHKEELEYA